MVLEKMKQIAENHLEAKGISTKIKNAVVTVPAYFNSAQKQATRDACRIAGLNAQRIINEPTAASLAYHQAKLSQNEEEEEEDDDEEKIILIYDLGGGTLDVSLLSMVDGGIGVISSDGDTYLGGRDFDEVLVKHCIKKFKDQHGVDLTKKVYQSAYQVLRGKCEKAKIELTTNASVTIDAPSLVGIKGLKESITRE